VDLAWKSEHPDFCYAKDTALTLVWIDLAGRAPHLQPMSQIAYVNGRYLPAQLAAVSFEDRGFQFADGVYEVFALFNGRILDMEGHLVRLARSCRELDIPLPMASAPLQRVIAEVIRRNRVQQGTLYLQVTRGVARRDHPFPAVGTRPTLVMTARPMDMLGKARLVRTGVRVSTQPDIRWGRCDIKTIALLPNVLAKQAAKQAGAFEALFVDGETVTEGGSTNMWMVDAAGRVITHPDNNAILPGIMRDTLMRVARAAQIPVVEQKFTRTEMGGATEAFLTSTTAPCLPIVAIDTDVVGRGTPGPVTVRLAQLMWQEIARQTGYTLPADVL
jgi:D-alanine transaminase